MVRWIHMKRLSDIILKEEKKYLSLSIFNSSNRSQFKDLKQLTIYDEFRTFNSIKEKQRADDSLLTDHAKNFYRWRKLIK